MNEDYLHYLWRYGLFCQDNLVAEGQEVKVIRAGDYNMNEGPDFLQARIRIGDKEWVGHVEIHVNASDWQLHQHAKQYDNVILHVVLNNDQLLKRQNGESIPTLELKEHIDLALYETYKLFIQNKSWVACYGQLRQMDDIKIKTWLSKLLVDRLERKSKEIEDLLLRDNKNWEHVLLQLLGRYLGAPVNSSAFEALLRSFDLTILSKQADSPLQTEALLLGQAGLLEDTMQEAYTQLLKREYVHLKNKYSLTPMNSGLWNFFRLRPVSFPAVRIALLASLVRQSQGMFSKLLECSDAHAVRKIVMVSASDYWTTHYQIDTPAKSVIKSISAEMADKIIINVVVPLLFVYGKQMQQDDFSSRAIDLLESLAPEQNQIVRKWKAAGIQAANAFESQALLQLKQHYCEQNKCLSCAIGNDVLRQN